MGGKLNRLRVVQIPESRSDSQGVTPAVTRRFEPSC